MTSTTTHLDDQDITPAAKHAQEQQGYRPDDHKTTFDLSDPESQALMAEVRESSDNVVRGHYKLTESCNV